MRDRQQLELKVDALEDHVSRLYYDMNIASGRSVPGKLGKFSEFVGSYVQSAHEILTFLDGYKLALPGEIRETLRNLQQSMLVDSGSSVDYGILEDRFTEEGKLGRGSLDRESDEALTFRADRIKLALSDVNGTIQGLGGMIRGSNPIDFENYLRNSVELVTKVTSYFNDLNERRRAEWKTEVIPEAVIGKLNTLDRKYKPLINFNGKPKGPNFRSWYGKTKNLAGVESQSKGWRKYFGRDRAVEGEKVAGAVFVSIAPITLAAMVGIGINSGGDDVSYSGFSGSRDAGEERSGRSQDYTDGADRREIRNFHAEPEVNTRKVNIVPEFKRAEWGSGKLENDIMPPKLVKTDDGNWIEFDVGEDAQNEDGLHGIVRYDGGKGITRASSRVHNGRVKIFIGDGDVSKYQVGLFKEGTSTITYKASWVVDGGHVEDLRSVARNPVKSHREGYLKAASRDRSVTMHSYATDNFITIGDIVNDVAFGKEMAQGHELTRSNRVGFFGKLKDKVKKYFS
tara:strand:+ start:24369 stop:25904 length:1536 start_codon:yes stop_codon:yes gene_type:complete